MFVELIGVDKSELAELTPMVGTLAAANQVTLVSPAEKAQIPAGCAKVTVSAKCAVSIALQVRCWATGSRWRKTNVGP